MAFFCRITGHSRNLPKPCYFPLLPPISPAEAKKICRITGKAQSLKHNYSPIISFGKPLRFDGVIGCRVTKHEDFAFLRPVFTKTKDNEKTIGILKELLEKIGRTKKRKVDITKQYVYNLSDDKVSIVVPSEMEEAIRAGEIESFSMSNDQKDASVKIKQNRIIKVLLEKLLPDENLDDMFHGEGQSKEVLEEQQMVINERNKRKQETMAKRKIFEDKEKRAEEEERKATERPPSKRPRVKFDPKKRQEKLEKMERMMREQKDNKAIILPKFDPVSKADPDEQLQYERMLADIASAQRHSTNLTVVATGFNWKEAEDLSSAGFDWDSFPHEEWIDPVEVTPVVIKKEETIEHQESLSLAVAAAVETVIPVSGPSKDILESVQNIKDEKVLKMTENVSKTIKNLKSEDSVPNIEEMKEVTSSIHAGETGYLVARNGKSEFVATKDFVAVDGATALFGAMVMVNNKKKFVSGQIIKIAEEESFVAGQTLFTENGKVFVPGQTVKDSCGNVKFIPGHTVKTDNGDVFVAGQTMQTSQGSKFVAGQVMNKGDGENVFVSGQTIMTEDGPKFLPGEVTIDEYGEDMFVPGMTLPMGKGDVFVPGQTFQSEKGISFTPGQIVETSEGPSFIPGKTFNTPEGKKFLKGDLVQEDNGSLKFVHKPLDLPDLKQRSVIPNEKLQPLAFADRVITGFSVNPANTAGLVPGQKVYGDIVESAESVLFYLSGKLPDTETPPDAKIISGQLVVGEDKQRFIPGRFIESAEGEKFVPGQVVCTANGEEFIPGQIVETSNGPKFVPGQLVITLNGEKFVPGQVIVEAEGPKFVPGQIIQTEKGAAFIPGQMMNTDEGQKFVPGQLVETSDGPRFVSWSGH